MYNTQNYNIFMLENQSYMHDNYCKVANPILIILSDNTAQPIASLYSSSPTTIMDPSTAALLANAIINTAGCVTFVIWIIVLMVAPKFGHKGRYKYASGDFLTMDMACAYAISITAISTIFDWILYSGVWNDVRIYTADVCGVSGLPDCPSRPVFVYTLDGIEKIIVQVVMFVMLLIYLRPRNTWVTVAGIIVQIIGCLGMYLLVRTLQLYEARLGLMIVGLTFNVVALILIWFATRRQNGIDYWARIWWTFLIIAYYIAIFTAADFQKLPSELMVENQHITRIIIVVFDAFKVGLLIYIVATCKRNKYGEAYDEQVPSLTPRETSIDMTRTSDYPRSLTEPATPTSPITPMPRIPSRPELKIRKTTLRPEVTTPSSSSSSVIQTPPVILSSPSVFQEKREPTSPFKPRKSTAEGQQRTTEGKKDVATVFDNDSDG